MNRAIFFLGTTRAGKSNAVIYIGLRLLKGDYVLLYLDPQPNSAGLKFYNACREQGFQCVLEDLDSDLYLPCNFGQATGDERLNALAISNLMESLAAARGMVNAFSHPQIAQYAEHLIRVKMFTGKKFSQLGHAWFKDTNRSLLSLCKDSACVQWLSTRPTTRSSLARDCQPAVRFLKPLSEPTVSMRDVGESHTIDILNEGTSIVVQGGTKCTPRELRFLLSHRAMEVFQAAQFGYLTRPVIVVQEEAEL